MDQQHYVGLDVSLETTSICVLDLTAGWFGAANALSEPDAISPVRAHQPRPSFGSGLRPDSFPTGLPTDCGDRAGGVPRCPSRQGRA